MSVGRALTFSRYRSEDLMHIVLLWHRSTAWIEASEGTGQNDDVQVILCREVVEQIFHLQQRRVDLFYTKAGDLQGLPMLPLLWAAFKLVHHRLSFLRSLEPLI
jgi:hypothetical protein